MKIKSILAFFLAAVMCFTAVPVQVFASEATYFVAGCEELCGSYWQEADPANQMTHVGDGIYEITYTAVPAGLYDFKITDGTWDNSWGGQIDGVSSNYMLTVENDCDVTITFNSNIYRISVSGEGITVEPEIIADYFVAGSPELCGSEWNEADPANQLTYAGEGIYEITYTAVPAGEYQFKITDGTWNNSWGGSGSDGNYALTVKSECDVTITFNTNVYVITVTGEGIYEEEIVINYFVAGDALLCVSEWNEADPANQMTDAGDGIYEITYTAVPVGEYQFKITDGTWYNCWGDADGPDGNYLLVVETACDVTIRFDSVNYIVTATGDGVPEKEIVEGYFVGGDAGLCGSEWEAADPANQMTQVSDGIYEITYTSVEAGVYEFKVTAGTWNNSWGGEYGNYQLTVPQTGDVTIRFDSTTNEITVDVPETELVEIYFNTYFTGWENVNAYYWGGPSAVEWPGAAMTLVEGSESEWVCQIPANATNVIFNNGEAQTDDLTIPTDGKNYSDGFRWMTYGEAFQGPSGSVNDTITWTLTDGVLTVSGTGEVYYESEDQLPWYPYRSYIRQIVISEGITRIGDYVFSGLELVEQVTFCDTLTEIGRYAFSDCASLAEVTLPSNLASVELGAFYNCDGLAKITIPRSLKTAEYPFDHCDNLKTVVFETGVTKIVSNLFGFCPGLETISIPDTVTTIEDSAFSSCVNLASVELPDTVTTIKDHAFYGCEGLARVEIPNSVATIGAYAFENCDSLTKVTLPQSLKVLGQSAFSDCNALVEINIPKSLTQECGYGPFAYCNNLKTVTFDTGLTMIPAGLFQHCDGLEQVILPDSVKEIGDSAFYCATNLKSVKLPEGLSVIAYSTFDGCVSLVEVQGMDAVTQIGDYAFGDCTSLKQIQLPVGLTSIGVYSFNQCTSLETIQIPDSVTVMGSFCFTGCTSLQNVKLPEGIDAIPYGAFSQCTALTVIEIPDSVTVIDNDAFNGCTGLAVVTLSENLEEICDYAFYGCASLIKLYIPKFTDYLGYQAFAGCETMTEVVFGGSAIDYIPDETFADCYALTHVVLPMGLESIYAGVFKNCYSLTEITIPNSVSYIDTTAFSYPSKTTIYSHDSEYLTTFAEAQGFTYVETDHSYQAATLPPTCTDEGKITSTCMICGYVAIQSIPANGHSYDGDICTVCGAGLVVPTLTLNYPSLSFEDEILYNVYYSINNTTSVVEMGLITFAERLTDGTIADAVDIIPGYVNSGSTYMVQSNGIPAKNLSDAVYFKVYAKLADGSYVYTDVAGYHAVAYAKTVLNSNSADKAKALVVAMLNYGAAAQEYFGYKTDALMNASLTAEQLALVSAYNESMVQPVVKADAGKVGSFVMNGGYSNIFPTVSFEGAFSINFYFTPSKTVDAAPTFYYWDAKTYASVDVLNPENATGVLTMKQDGNNWGAAVEGIAAKAIDETIYVAGFYTSNGVEYPTGIVSYSLGNYCKTVAANGTAFGAATAVYGFYAKAYFA